MKNSMAIFAAHPDDEVLGVGGTIARHAAAGDAVHVAIAAEVETYRHEMRPWPHARSTASIEHLGRWRGASVGMHMAEAFMMLRDVIE